MMSAAAMSAAAMSATPNKLKASLIPIACKANRNHGMCADRPVRPVLRQT